MEKSKRVPENHIFLLLTMPKPLTVWITINSGKFWKRWEYKTTWPASWEICMQFKNQQLELDMEQQTGSRSGKEYVKAAYCHPAYLTYMQSTSCKMPGWMKHKLGSRLAEEISITSHIWWHHLYGRKQRETKEPHDEGERREWKSWLETQHSKTKIMASSPMTLWQIDRENSERLYFGGLQNHCRWWQQPWN